jgi:hypothetical protein
LKWQLRKNGSEDISLIVWEWFVSVRARNMWISKPLAQVYAKEGARRQWKAAHTEWSGWLERKRWTVVTFFSVDLWLETLRNLRSQGKPWFWYS